MTVYAIHKGSKMFGAMPQDIYADQDKVVSEFFKIIRSITAILYLPFFGDDALAKRFGNNNPPANTPSCAINSLRLLFGRYCIN